MSADLATWSPRAAAEPGPAAQAMHARQARHLHPAALPRWHALLEVQWRARLERVTELSLAYHDAEEAGADRAGGAGGRDARLAARRRARAILHRAVAERRALAEIDAALARLATGRFGWCEQCGSVIATTRLTEMPQSRYCAACQPDAGGARRLPVPAVSRLPARPGAAPAGSRRTARRAGPPSPDNPPCPSPTMA